MSILGAGALQVIIVLGLTYGIGSARVVRGAVIGIKENAYFQAAQAVGSPPWRTVLRHVLPNVMAPIIFAVFVDLALEAADLRRLPPALPVGMRACGSAGGHAPARGRPYTPPNWRRFGTFGKRIRHSRRRRLRLGSLRTP